MALITHDFLNKLVVFVRTARSKENEEVSFDPEEGLALAAAYSMPIVTDEMEIVSYYTSHCGCQLAELVIKLNEEEIIDTERVCELARTFYRQRMSSLWSFTSIRDIPEKFQGGDAGPACRVEEIQEILKTYW